jgi:trk system potassium uptake protein TrkA
VRVHVVIVGCGRVGSGLAMALQADGHSVAILDKNVRAFRRLSDAYVGQRLVGSGFDRDDLEAAGAVGAHALAAVTSGDNTNILTVRIARENYRIARVVARIYDPRRAEIYQRLGIPTVATVTWTIDQVHRSLVPDRISAEWVDSSAKLVLVERRLPEGWAGRILGEIEEGGRLKLVAVTRAGSPRLDASDLVGQEGDVLHIAASKDALDLLAERLGGAVPAVVGKKPVQ